MGAGGELHGVHQASRRRYCDPRLQAARRGTHALQTPAVPRVIVRPVLARIFPPFSTTTPPAYLRSATVLPGNPAATSWRPSPLKSDAFAGFLGFAAADDADVAPTPPAASRTHHSDRCASAHPAHLFVSEAHR